MPLVMLLVLLGPLILVLLGPLILVLLGPLILVLLGPLILVLLTFLHSPRVPVTQGSPPQISAAILSSTGILVPLEFSSVLVLLTFLHLHLGPPCLRVTQKILVLL